jgi:ribonuclease HI
MGEFMGASALTIPGIFDPAVMEVLASREAMALAWDLNLQNITVETDCLSLISALEQPYAASFSKVLEEVKEDVRLFSRASFRHENRASNSDAHRFARFSISSEVRCQVWLVQPLMVFVSSTEEWCSLKPVGAGHQPREKGHWLPPEDGWLNANADDALSAAEGHGGGGVVVRNHHGVSVAESCCFFPYVSDPECAELLACLRAAQLAKAMGVNKLVMELTAREL